MSQISPDRKSSALSAVKVLISRDRLTASLSLQGRYDYLATDEIRRQLARAGVVFGIKENIIDLFSVDPTREPIVVAEGVPPVPGKDGHIEVLFGQGSIKLDIIYDDVVDFRETSKIISVEAGTELVVVHPPEPGSQGIAVTGEALEPPRPKEIKLMAGKGVVLTGDGMRATSTVSGKPWIKEAGLNRVVHCDPVYVHSGDVDIKTGNLRFKGDVQITGSVCEAMEVDITGSVEVHGLVTMARIMSTGKMLIYGNVISSRLRAGILFPGAKKLAFMMTDIHNELQSLAQAMDQLASKKIIDFELVDFGRVALSLLDSRYKNIRPMVKSIQGFVKNKTEELPQEVIDAINALNCFSGLKPLNREIFENVLRDVTGAWEQLFESKTPDGASIVLKSAVSSAIQSSGNATVIGQGCINTNITAGGNVLIRGSFKGGEILCDGSAEINELGSSLGAPPVVRVAPGGTIKVRRAFGGSVIQVGNRRLTLTKEMNSFRAKLNKEDQLELY